MLCFIVLCLSIAQRVVDLVSWCADSSGDYYEEQTDEDIPEDLQSAEEEREWRANDVQYRHHTWHERDTYETSLGFYLFTLFLVGPSFIDFILFNGHGYWDGHYK